MCCSKLKSKGRFPLLRPQDELQLPDDEHDGLDDLEAQLQILEVGSRAPRV